MSIAELAEKITTLLAPAMPYLQKAEGEAMAEVVTREDADGWRQRTDVLWQWLQPKLGTRPAAMEAVADLAGEPDNQDFQATFRVQLRKVLSEDATFAANLARFLASVSIPPAQPVNQAMAIGSGSIARDGGVAAGAGGAAIGGNAGNVHVVNVGPGANLFLDRPPARMTDVDRDTALGRYLRHIISHNRYLQLQGIRSGGRLVHIELERIFICLRATQRRLIVAGERWPGKDRMPVSGERTQPDSQATLTTEIVTVSIGKALSKHPRLVVLGDPGSGKSTLLRYLALISARDLAEGRRLVQDRLGSAEPRRLPILLPLRQIGRFLQARPDEGTEGHARLIEYLIAALASERIELPKDFFDPWLTGGDALILLDGLDEVVDPGLRRRVSRLVESFTQTYPRCRYVVTSRIVGYTDAARLGESYAVTTMLDFSREDIARFLGNWHRLIAVAQMGEGESTDAFERRLLTDHLETAANAGEEPELAQLASVLLDFVRSDWITEVPPSGDPLGDLRQKIGAWQSRLLARPAAWRGVVIGLVLLGSACLVAAAWLLILNFQTLVFAVSGFPRLISGAGYSCGSSLWLCSLGSPV